MQVKVWDRTKLYGFWQKWYFPANATLYIVGDISSPSALQDAVKCIEKSFGSVPVGKHEDGTRKVRHLGLPPVQHAFGLGDLPPGAIFLFLFFFLFYFLFFSAHSLTDA